MADNTTIFVEVARDFLNSNICGLIRSVLKKCEETDPDDPWVDREFGDLKRGGIQCLQELSRVAKKCGYRSYSAEIEKIISEIGKTDPHLDRTSSRIEWLEMKLEKLTRRTAGSFRQERWPDPEEKKREVMEYQSKLEAERKEFYQSNENLAEF